MPDTGLKTMDRRPLMEAVVQYELDTVAQSLVAEGKGILAADESTGTIKKRFDAIKLESSEESRRAYRDLLFTTADVETYISGVILNNETIRQSKSERTPFTQILSKKGLGAGVKGDQG